jgi:hypothetical protein
MKKSRFKNKQKVTILPKQDASERTKARISSHGPGFVLFRTINAWLDPEEWGKDECIVVGSLTTGEDFWLPLEEVEIFEENA